MTAYGQSLGQVEGLQDREVNLGGVRLGLSLYPDFMNLVTLGKSQLQPQGD